MKWLLMWLNASVATLNTKIQSHTSHWNHIELKKPSKKKTQNEQTQRGKTPIKKPSNQKFNTL